MAPDGAREGGRETCLSLVAAFVTGTRVEELEQMGKRQRSSRILIIQPDSPAWTFWNRRPSVFHVKGMTAAHIAVCPCVCLSARPASSLLSCVYAEALWI